MESIKEVKEWLLTKCKIPNINVHYSQSSENNETQAFCSVVTPQNIPEFVIPGSNDSSRHASIGTCSFDGDFPSNNSSEASLPCSAHTSPGVSPRGSFSGLGVHIRKSPIHVRSCPVSPGHEPTDFAGHSCNQTKSWTNIISLDGDDTNADPQSVAAIGLPHFKIQTSYGFTTLSESPHTRRKESLFHAASKGNPQFDLHNAALNDLRIRYRCDSMDLPEGRRPSGSLHPNDVPSCARLPANRMSTVSLVCPKEDDLPPKGSCRRTQKYYRRRSSLPGLQPVPSWKNEAAEATSNSLESSPAFGRRERNRLRVGNPTTYKRHSSPNPSPTREIPLEDIQRRFSSMNHLVVPTTNCQPLSEAPLGELKFSFHYLPDTRELKVLLIKAENLGGESRDNNMNVFAKLAIMPGKIQKQTSEIIKHTKSPVFNESFLFTDVPYEKLQKMSLRIKLCTKSHVITETLGEVNIELSKFDLFQEIRMWRALEPNKDTEDLGHLLLSLLYDPRDEQLLVGVGQAKGLPQHLTGGPNPYVRVEVMQTGKGINRIHTRTLKNTAQPMFNEVFTFTVSSDIQDMKCTAVVLTVFDHDRLRSDEVIGQVRLGYGATEESEISHWNDTLCTPGCEHTKWHYIMEKTRDNS
ncbi:synaptotagmin-7-like [Gigantopelta aegis]|uniref:synaptotagmin-7-like n=1 Tax=Gigantopelta aegis TaxID=1735272 RepID=UPI001B88A6CD|nr:synaptotagmin-7-like [Gigantopelta aegis]